MATKGKTAAVLAAVLSRPGAQFKAIETKVGFDPGTQLMNLRLQGKVRREGERLHYRYFPGDGVRLPMPKKERRAPTPMQGQLVEVPLDAIGGSYAQDAAAPGDDELLGKIILGVFKAMKRG